MRPQQVYKTEEEANKQHFNDWYLRKLKRRRIFFILGNEKLTQACDARKPTFYRMNGGLKNRNAVSQKLQ